MNRKFLTLLTVLMLTISFSYCYANETALPSALKGMEKAIPDNPAMVAVFDIKGILNSPIVKTMKIDDLLAAGNKEMKKQGVKLQIQDISRIVVAVSEFDNSPALYFETSKAIRNLKDIADKYDHEDTHNDISFGIIENQDMAIARLTNNIFILGEEFSVTDAIDSFQDRKTNNIKTDDKMKKALEQLKNQKTFIAIQLPEDASAALAMFGINAQMDIMTMGLTVNNNIALDGSLTMANAEQATQIATMIPGMVSMFKMQMQTAPAMLKQQEEALKKEVAAGNNDALVQLKNLQAEKQQMETMMSAIELLGSIKFTAKENVVAINMDIPQDKIVSLAKPIIEKAREEIKKQD